MPITIIPRAIDVDLIIAGARTALLANTTISAAVGTRIYPELAPEGAASPFIILALASTVYESAYNDPIINALLDVSCYTEGESTTAVRALLTACVTALIDTAWTITGLAKIGATMEEAGTGFRNVTSVTNGVIVRGRQATIRVRAEKTA